MIPFSAEEWEYILADVMPLSCFRFQGHWSATTKEQVDALFFDAYQKAIQQHPTLQQEFRLEQIEPCFAYAAINTPCMGYSWIVKPVRTIKDSLETRIFTYVFPVGQFRDWIHANTYDDPFFRHKLSQIVVPEWYVAGKRPKYLDMAYVRGYRHALYKRNAQNTKEPNKQRLWNRRAQMSICKVHYIDIGAKLWGLGVKGGSLLKDYRAWL